MFPPRYEGALGYVKGKNGRRGDKRWYVLGLMNLMSTWVTWMYAGLVSSRLWASWSSDFAMVKYLLTSAPLLDHLGMTVIPHMIRGIAPRIIFFHFLVGYLAINNEILISN